MTQVTAPILDPSDDPKDQGKIRLSLIDVMYGVILGYGFNFFVEDEPNEITSALFLLAVLAIVCDWMFVHKPYWKQPEAVTNLAFLLDLAILLTFAFMIRYAVKPPHEKVVLFLGLVFCWYAIWDLACRRALREQGRNWFGDFLWDSSGAAAFIALWFFVGHNVLQARTVAVTIPNWTTFDVTIQVWIVVAFVLYAIFGPHTLWRKGG